MKPPLDTVTLPDRSLDAVGVVRPRRWWHTALPLFILILGLLQTVMTVADPAWYRTVLAGLFLGAAILQLVINRSSTGLLLLIDDDGLELRGEWGRWTTIPWSAITGLEIEPNHRVLRVQAPGGISRGGRVVDAERYRFTLFGALPTSKTRLLAYLEHRWQQATGRPAEAPPGTRPG